MATRKLKDSPAVKMMRKLCQKDAAWLLGISDRALRAHRDAPRRRDGTYCAQALIGWRMTHSGPIANGDPLLAGSTSPALEEYRRHRAGLARIELEERTGKLINVDDFSEWWETEVAAPIRRGIEALKQQHGEEAAEQILKRLRAVETVVEQRCRHD